MQRIKMMQKNADWLDVLRTVKPDKALVILAKPTLCEVTNQ